MSTAPAPTASCNGIKLRGEILCWVLLSAPNPHTYWFAPIHHGLSWSSRSCPSSGLTGSLLFSQPWSSSLGHWTPLACHQWWKQRQTLSIMCVPVYEVTIMLSDSLALVKYNLNICWEPCLLYGRRAIAKSKMELSREIKSAFTISLLKFLHVIENVASWANVLQNIYLGQNGYKIQQSCHYFFLKQS